MHLRCQALKKSAKLRPKYFFYFILPIHPILPSDLAPPSSRDPMPEPVEPHIIDLHFFHDHAIASYLIPSVEGLIIVDSGPYSVFPALKSGIEALGYRLEDVRHVLLSHIHFDHAGAAWALAAGGAKVYVHPLGYRHMQDPTRLYGSAKRIYGDMMEALWGEMNGISEERLISVPDGEQVQIGEHTFRAWHTPGHASHHIAWQWGDQIFSGDVAGCRIDSGPVVPPCPPPDIDIEAWMSSIDLILGLQPRVLYLTHFGSVREVTTHLAQLKDQLQGWAAWIRPRWEQKQAIEEVVPDFQAYAAAQLRAAGLDDKGIARYEAANPAWMSVAGLYRYWTQRAAT